MKNGSDRPVSVGTEKLHGSGRLLFTLYGNRAVGGHKKSNNRDPHEIDFRTMGIPSIVRSDTVLNIQLNNTSNLQNSGTSSIER